MPHDDDGRDDLFVPIRAALPKINPPSRVKRRLIESAVAIDEDDPESLLFQHRFLPGRIAVSRSW